MLRLNLEDFFMGSDKTFASKIIDIMLHCMLSTTCKVTTEAALGLIGGTMGLLTGFSILSGVEIIYYLFRFYIHIILSAIVSYDIPSYQIFTVFAYLCLKQTSFNA